METTREHLLEHLTGLKSSKRTYYPEYREKERRLDRAIASIANISAALCNTTSGVPFLAQAVVRVAAQHFEADWAVLALNDADHRRWIAGYNGHEAAIQTNPDTLPALDSVIDQVIAQRRLIVAITPGLPGILGEPMFLRQQLVGALVVMPGHQFVLDERELSVLQTLANQAAVAFENARLYEESERLRAEATAHYEETYRQKTQLEEQNRQLERARRRLIRARQNETVNKERNRIARELHDNVAQHLISIGMHLEWCRAQLPPQTPVYERICSTKEMARGAITRVREAIFELSTIKTSQVSLIEALHDLASDFTRRTHLQVQIRVADAPGTLPAELEYACYHIVQEALFNAYKHAQAGNAWIAVRFDAELVQITVTDDGIGIPEAYLRREQSPPGDRPVGHFGLCSMHERAQEIGGDLTIMRRPSGGTEVCITAPLQMINRSKQCEHAYSVNDC
jgi:signal transduction histidine kinase